MLRLIKKFFLIKEIKSKKGVLHFRRWRIISLPWFSIYIHNIYKHDEDLHLHDHPWNYFSFILKGSYVEETIKGKTLMSFGRLTKKDATDFHKISTVIKPTTTLFIIGKRKREWGYNVDGKWVDNITYRKEKNNSREK